MNWNFCLFFNIFVPKNMFLKSLNGPLFIWTLWLFFLEFPSSEITSTTLNIFFHINLGRFVGDGTHIIQRL
jgi:hypothetical protein